MPAQQRRRRDEERFPAVAREELTRRCKEQSVDHRECGTPALSSQNGQFVPTEHNLQFFEVVRPNAQGRELEKPMQHHVAERDKHEASAWPILRTGFNLPSLSVD